jgi:hypothetical protein
VDIYCDKSGPLTEQLGGTDLGTIEQSVDGHSKPHQPQHQRTPQHPPSQRHVIPAEGLQGGNCRDGWDGDSLMVSSNFVHMLVVGRFKGLSNLSRSELLLIHV